MYKLIIQDDEGKTTVVPLIREELTIGRQEGNTIRLTERNVSRRHAKLLRGQEEIIIEDLDSYNGVRVNGSRIQGRAEIKEADRVQIGDYLIEVKADQPNQDAQTREIAVLSDDDAPAPVAVSASEAATAPTSVPVTTPAPAPAPAAPAPTNGAGPNLSADAAAAIVSPDAEHQYGRLVILSSTMAGREFELDKPAMVIGRTEENDIWVNHRSISRHHAKVVRENGTYAIVDLQSANGVRVNGEEYGKVELRTRDVVDLGHVRFRFVAPGEDFVFGRDAQPVDIATEGRPSKALWGAVALLVVGVIAFLVVGGGDKKDEKSTVENPGIVDDPPDPLDPPPPPAVVIDASVEDIDTSGDQALAELLNQALAAQKRDLWPAMGQAAQKALAIDPTNQKALEYAEVAEFEGANSKLFEKFHQASGRKKWAQLASAFGQIDSNSVYKIRGEADHDRLKGEYERMQRQAAEKLAKKNKCSDIERIARNTPQEWSDVASAISGVRCKDSSGGTRPNNTTNNNNNNNNTPPPPDTGPSYDQLMAQAKAAVKDTQYGKGLKACRQALEKKPGDQMAVVTCVIASCNLKNAASAKKYLRKVKSATRKAGLKQICMRLNVKTDD
jgi:pSer/pThr/pTyr-binding forkhead associated (FHA) protein